MKHYYMSGSGRIELELTLDEARTGSHMGRCDEDVQALSEDPHIAEQLARVDAQHLRDELRGYGAWDEQELADHEQNLQRLLWLACGDIVDNAYEEEK
jgi:hypothetical protein